MGQCIEIRQNTIEEFFEQEIGWDSEYLQLSPGPLNFAITFVELPGIELFWNRFGNRMRLHEIYNGRWLMCGCVLDDSAPPVYRGRSFPIDHGFIYQPGIEHDFVIPDRCRSLMVHVEPSLVDQMGWTVNPAPAKPVPKGRLRALIDECRRATRQARADGGRLEGSADDLVLRDRILARLEAVLEPWLTETKEADSNLLSSDRALRMVRNTEGLFSRHDLQNASVEALAQHGYEECSVDSLAHELGVSQRTLFYAFRQSLCMGPDAYLRLVRLHRLRDRLLAGNASGVSVTHAAMELGFNHMGRLSEHYRRHFGESPRDTLKRSS